MDNLKWVLDSAEEWRMKKTDWWLASVLYLIGSWSSLFSLLWMIFIPLFLARGHPERLEINDSVAKLKHTAWVCVCARLWQRVRESSKRGENSKVWTFKIYERQNVYCTFCVRRSCQWYVPNHRTLVSGTWGRRHKKGLRAYSNKALTWWGAFIVSY